MGRKHVEKGEIACCKQFFLFPQCFFKRLVLHTRKSQGLFGEGLTLYLTIPAFNNPIEEGLWKIPWKKGEKAFSLFPTVFSAQSLRAVFILATFNNVICKCFQFGHIKYFVVWKRIKSRKDFLCSLTLIYMIHKSLTFCLTALIHSHTMTPFDAPEKQAF